MTDHPILYSAPMVLAQLGGRKTQTRRLATSPLRKCQSGDRLWVRENWKIGAWDVDTYGIAVDYPAGMTAQKEWLHPPNSDTFEHYWSQSSNELEAMKLKPNADGRFEWVTGESPLKIRPSIHMPRWASRLTNVVTEVRFQRLWDITETDTVVEGIRWGKLTRFYYITPDDSYDNPVDSYAAAWDSIHGHKPGEAWADNPEVVAITYIVHKCNIDRMTS